jgi:hypothetical protein
MHTCAIRAQHRHKILAQFDKSVQGDGSINGRKDGKEEGPDEVKGVGKSDIVDRWEATCIFIDIVSMTLDNFVWRGEENSISDRP